LKRYRSGIPSTSAHALPLLDRVDELIRRDRREGDPKPVVIHLLRKGVPIRGFTWELPRGWAPGHKWVGIDERQDATCVRCLEIAAK
jgi:hypothetical protein